MILDRTQSIFPFPLSPDSHNHFLVVRGKIEPSQAVPSAIIKLDLSSKQYQEGLDLFVGIAHQQYSERFVIPVPHQNFSLALKELGGEADLEQLQEKLVHRDGTLVIEGDPFYPQIQNAIFSRHEHKRGHSSIHVDLHARGPNTPLYRFLEAIEKGFRATTVTQSPPDYPRDRPIQRYEELTGESIRSKLDLWDIVIDVGCGKGIAAEALTLRGGNVIAVNIDREETRLQDPIHMAIEGPPVPIYSFKNRVPNNPILYAIAGRRARYALDIYGAISYCSNPIDALLYLSLLIRKDGLGVAVTEPERFHPSTWPWISKFFNLYSGQRVTFSTFKTWGDANQCYEKALRIKIKGEGRYEPILRKRWPWAVGFDWAKECFGPPKYSETPLWQSRSKRAKIWGVDYPSRTLR